MSNFIYRGQDFRPEYVNVLSIRSILDNVPVLGLSATVTAKVLKDVMQKMSLSNGDVIITSLPPDRPNVFLEMKIQSSYDVYKDLRWLVQSLATNQRQQPKTIVFVQSLREASDIFEMFTSELGDRAYERGERDPRRRLVSVFHGQVSKALQEYTLDEFVKPQSFIRVLVATIAFGMGVEIRDVREVVHWGNSKSVLSYWQQVGRCGRDGEASRAVWYPKAAVGGEDKQLFTQMKQDTASCLRLPILTSFIIPGMDVTSIDNMKDRQSCCNKLKCTPMCKCALCLCCSNCMKRCRCSTL